MIFLAVALFKVDHWCISNVQLAVTKLNFSLEAAEEISLDETLHDK